MSLLPNRRSAIRRNKVALKGPVTTPINDALGSVLTAGEVRTCDLGGTATTAEFADAVCRAIEIVESRTNEKAV